MFDDNVILRKSIIGIESSSLQFSFIFVFLKSCNRNEVGHLLCD